MSIASPQGGASVRGSGAARLPAPSESRFRVLVCCLTLGYVVLQTAYTLRLPLVMDEFQGAASVLRLAESLPYRDFLPYKTVLGYYAQLPLLLSSGSPWWPLLITKLGMSIVNAAVIGYACFALARSFRREAILLALLALVLMSTFLERSAELRVDMLTSLAGLLSLVALIEHRPLRAGVWAAVSFLVSQKGLFFLVAGGAGLGMAVLTGPDRKSAVGTAGRFALTALACILIYIAGWASVSSWSAVVTAIFGTARRVVAVEVYSIRLQFWVQTVSRNPFFYAAAILALLRVAKLGGWRKLPYAVRIVVPYAVAVICAGVWYRQPWPYFFVLLIPTLFVLNVVFFDIGLKLYGDRHVLGLAPPMWGFYGVLAVAIPLLRVPVNLNRDNSPQRATVELGSALLAPGETYLAGVDLLVHHRQAVGSLAWLGVARTLELRSSPELVRQALDSLRAYPPKIVIENERLLRLPQPIREWVDATYAPLWGNVKVYAPRLDPGETLVDVGFAGMYLVDGVAGSTMLIDADSVEAGETIDLERRPYRIATRYSSRLRLSLPNWRAAAREEFPDYRELFPRVYEY